MDCMLESFEEFFLNADSGTALVVQWLRLHVSTLEGMGLIPCLGN